MTDVHPNYLGPAIRVAPSALNNFEGFGWRMEPKIDGIWCLCAFDANHPRGMRIWSRLGNEIKDGRVKDLEFKDFTNLWPKPVVVGELKERRVYLFDTVPSIHATYLERREELETLYESSLHRGPFELLPSYSKGFDVLYRGIINDGGEGVVLKHEESYYHSSRKDRKTSHWLKCKPSYEPPGEAQ